MFSTNDHRLIVLLTQLGVNDLQRRKRIDSDIDFGVPVSPELSRRSLQLLIVFVMKERLPSSRSKFLACGYDSVRYASCSVEGGGLGLV